MLCMFFTEGPVECFADLAEVDVERFARYFWANIERGIYLAPSQYECMFPSVAHSDEDVEKTLAIHYETLKAVH